MSQVEATEAKRERGLPQHVQIIVNNQTYTTPKNPMKVAEIKEMAGLPLEFNLCRVVRGRNIGPLPNDQSIRLRKGDRFTVNCGEDPS